jgi:hypothetical protein
MAGRGPGRAKPKLRGETCSKAFLIRCMEDEEQPMRDRIDCAKAILPYQHSRMPTEVNSNLDGILEIVIRGAY